MSKFKSLPRAVDADRKATAIAVGVHPATVSASTLGIEEFGTLDFEGGGGSTRATIFLHTPVEYRSKRAALTALDDLVAALPVVVAGA